VTIPSPRLWPSAAPNRPRRSHLIALGLFLTCAALAFLLATPARAALPGDFDPSFGTAGKVQLQLGRHPTAPGSWANAIALRPDGKFILGGIAGDPDAQDANEFMLARLNPDGSLDHSFGSDGSVQLQLADPVSVSHVFQSGQDLSGIEAIALQPDGKIIAAGYAQVNENANDWPEFAIARLTADGTLDPTFGSGGVVHISVNQPGSRTQSVALQADGKIVAAGWADYDARGIDSDPEFAVVRLNPDGRLDSSFGVGGKVLAQLGQGSGLQFPQSGARSLVIQPDGRLAVAGWANDTVGNARFALARFNRDGTPDTTFGSNGTLVVQVSESTTSPASGIGSLALQPDGKLIAGGGAADPNSTAFSPAEVALARFNPDGGLDATFGSGGKVLVQMGDGDSPISGLYQIALQRDGKIVGAGVAGPDPTDGPSTYGFLVARFNSNGSVDSGFGAGGKVTVQMGVQDRTFPPWSNGRALALQPDKKIVVAGLGTYPNNSSQIGVIRVFGAPAPTASFDFAPASPQTGEGVTFTSTATDPDGSIVRTEWDFGQGFEDGAAQATHTFPRAGTYPVSLRVTDSEGQTATVTKQVSVADRPPTAVFSYAPSSPKTGEAVSFDGAASSDPDGAVSSYSWDFGDGSSATGATPSHAYAAAGSYTVRLTVTDDSGSVSQADAVVTAGDPSGSRPSAGEGEAERPSGSGDTQLASGLGGADAGGIGGVGGSGDGPSGSSRSSPGGSMSVPPGQSLASLLKRGLRVTVGCPVRCSASVDVLLIARTTGRSRRAGTAAAVTLARTRAQLASGTTTIYAKPVRGARRRLGRARHLGVTVRVRLAPAGGVATVLTRRVTLRG
jgi:uncharacterized delta-60 repeat protein